MNELSKKPNSYNATLSLHRHLYIFLKSMFLNPQKTNMFTAGPVSEVATIVILAAVVLVQVVIMVLVVGLAYLMEPTVVKIEAAILTVV